MAVDKLVDSTQLDSDLTSVANAIRTKGGTSAQLAFPAGFVSAIGAIPTGGGGITISPMSYPVSIRNDRPSGNVNITRILYDSTTLMSAVGTNVGAGTTSTFTDFATDGTHIWFRATPGTNITYNGNPATFDKSGAYFQLTIPAGFDGTIPFVIT